VKAYQELGCSLAPGMEISYVVRNVSKWEADTERDVLKFDARYYQKLPDKPLNDVSFVLMNANY
jgi:hypothetical protein